MRPRGRPGAGGAVRTAHWCRSASRRSQLDVPHVHLDAAGWLDVDVLVGRCLQCVDEQLAGTRAGQASVGLGIDHDYGVTAMQRHMLRSLAAGVADEFAEAGLGVLEGPGGCAGGGSVWGWCSQTGHADQNKSEGSELQSAC